MKRQPEVTFFEAGELPSGVVSLAERRALPLVGAWTLRGELNLWALAVSLYLQGVVDGYTAAEHQSEKGSIRDAKIKS